MKTRSTILALSLLLLLPLSALAGSVPPPPGPKDKCPVCGMFVAPNPTWICALKLEDGKVEYFDGPKDMFKRIFELKKKGVKHEPFATEYYSIELRPAKDQFFVTGSNVTGPMGKEIIPIATEKEARIFRRDHGALAVLYYDQVTPEIVKTLE